MFISIQNDLQIREIDFAAIWTFLSRFQYFSFNQMVCRKVKFYNSYWLLVYRYYSPIHLVGRSHHIKILISIRIFFKCHLFSFWSWMCLRLCKSVHCFTQTKQNKTTPMDVNACSVVCCSCSLLFCGDTGSFAAFSAFVIKSFVNAIWLKCYSLFWMRIVMRIRAIVAEQRWRNATKPTHKFRSFHFAVCIFVSFHRSNEMC